MSEYEDSCHDAATWECCTRVASGEMIFDCDDFDDKDECEASLTYECARTDNLCEESDADIAERIYWIYNGEYTPYIFWWYDETNNTLQGSCYCIYEYFIDTCPTSSPTRAPSIAPTNEPTSYNATTPDLAAS